jgi:hypothetical protein
VQLVAPGQQQRAQPDVGEGERHDQAQPFEIGAGGGELGAEQEIVDVPAAGPAEGGDRQAHPHHQGGEVVRHAPGLHRVAGDLREHREVGAHHGAAHHGRDEHQLVGRGVEADFDVAVGEAEQDGAAVVDHQHRQQRQRQRPGVGQELAARGQAQPYVGEAEDAVVLQVPEIVADQGEREGERVGGEQVDIAGVPDQQE